jgi:hypothetical protein
MAELEGTEGTALRRSRVRLKVEPVQAPVDRQSPFDLQ